MNQVVDLTGSEEIHVVANQGASIGDLLRVLFERLEQAEIVYCVLRNYDGLPDTVGNDVDILVGGGNIQDVQNLLVDTAVRQGWSLVKHERRYGFRSYYFFSGDLSSQSDFLHLDIFSPIHWKGVTWVSSPLILESRVKQGIFYTPNPGIEAAMLLFKDLLQHGRVEKKYRTRIRDLTTRDPSHFRLAVQPLTGDKACDLVLEAINRAEWRCIEGNAPGIRRTIIWHAFTIHPFTQIARWTRFLWGHLSKYFVNPTGIFIVLIGSDGAGKSTVASQVTEALDKPFPRSRVLNFRPGLLPTPLRIVSSMFRRLWKPQQTEVPSEAADTGPRLSPYSFVRSLAHLGYYTLDFLLGHVLLFFSRGRGELVIIERYYYDYLIQSRYANLPDWLPSALLAVLPRPDAVIYLRGASEKVHERKQELPIEELERQALVFERLLSRLRNTHRVDANHSLPEVIRQVGNIVLTTAGNRCVPSVDNTGNDTSIGKRS